MAESKKNDAYCNPEYSLKKVTGEKGKAGKKTTPENDFFGTGKPVCPSCDALAEKDHDKAVQHDVPADIRLPAAKGLEKQRSQIVDKSNQTDLIGDALKQNQNLEIAVGKEGDQVPVK